MFPNVLREIFSFYQMSVIPCFLDGSWQLMVILFIMEAENHRQTETFLTPLRYSRALEGGVYDTVIKQAVKEN